MASRNSSLRAYLIFIAVLVCFFCFDVGFSTGNKTEKRSLRNTNPPKEKWHELLKRDPYPYTIPLLKKPTELDGTYVKRAKKEGKIVPCRRCPDWLPYPGMWWLNLNKGAYRIYHNTTGWRSIGSFIVAGNRIIFANDPSCINGIGVYTWKLEKEKLVFDVIDDDCAIKLRALNLMEVPWDSCQPPVSAGAMTEKWQKPRGCD